jgi:hypothetical protein
MDLRSISPGQNAVAVTPSDTTIVGCRSLYIGVTGDVTLDLPGGATSVLFKAVPVGILPVAALRVKATGTAATNIVAIY